MKRFTSWLTAICIVIAASSIGLSEPVNAESNVMTRGDFFKAVTDFLELKPADQNLALPKDVDEDSIFADSVRALLERKIIYGYNDGTIRIDQSIRSNEANIILARILGLSGKNAEETLNREFQVAFGNRSPITASQAAEVIEKVLNNDHSIVGDLMKAYNKQMKAITSYRMDIEQKTAFHLTDPKSKGSEEPILIKTKSKSEFHLKKGYHFQSVMEKSDSPAGSITMEQYILPEGIFVQVANSISREPEPTWIRAKEVIPLDFDQLMQLQLNNMIQDQLINERYLFYRSLGTEVIKDRKIHHIQLFGSLPSLGKLTDSLKSLLGDNPGLKEFIESPEMPNMTVSMNGILKIDVDSKMLTEINLTQTIRNTDKNDKIPFEQADFETTIQYYDYNKVIDIQIPERLPLD